MAKTVIVKGFPGGLHYRAKVQAAKEQVTWKDLRAIGSGITCRRACAAVGCTRGLAVPP
jgi:hypothetical protein